MFKRFAFVITLFVMSSYSLKSMDLSLEAPTQATAPTARVAPVEDKHAERKVPALKTPEGEMSDTMAVAIAARLKATNQTNEQYLAMLSDGIADTYQDIETTAARLEMPLVSYLESLDGGAKAGAKKEAKQERLPDNTANDTKVDVKQTAIIVDDKMLAAISEKVRAAIIKRSKAPDEKSALYKDYVATMAARAQKGGDTWEQYLQNLEYRTTEFNDLTFEQALELDEWIVHNHDVSDSGEFHCCCVVTDKMRATISNKMQAAILKQSKTRDVKSEEYTDYIEMLLEAARDSKQELVEYLTTLEDRADASHIDLEIILKSVEEIFGDCDISDRMRAAIRKRSNAPDAKSEQYRNYEDKLCVIAQNKRLKLGRYLKMLEDEADAHGVDLEILLKSLEDTINCKVCFEDKNLTDFEKLRCENQNHHHIICTECLTGLTLDAIRNRNMSTLVCPDPACKMTLFPEGAYGSQEIKEVLTNEDIKHFETPTKPCPNLRCRALIEKNDGCSHMTCKMCKHEFCWNCLGKWTLPHDCPPEVRLPEARPIQLVEARSKLQVLKQHVPTLVLLMLVLGFFIFSHR